MTLAEALRKATNFIWATEICDENSGVLKKAKAPGDKNFNRGDRNPGPRERRPQFEAIDPRYTTDARSILMEVSGHPTQLADKRQIDQFLKKGPRFL